MHVVCNFVCTVPINNVEGEARPRIAQTDGLCSALGDRGMHPACDPVCSLKLAPIPHFRSACTPNLRLRCGIRIRVFRWGSGAHGLCESIGGAERAIARLGAHATSEMTAK